MIFEGFSLAARVQWLIRLRWIAVVAVVTTIAVSGFLKLIVGAAPLLLVAGLLAAANAGFVLMARSGKALSASAGAQVITDMLALTFLLHYAGGSANPFAFFYVFHVIIASVLFSARAAYLIAVVSTVLYGGLTAADVLGYCPRHPLVGAPSYFSTRYALGRLAAFAATVTASAYFGTTIVGALRRKQEELRESRERLAQAEKLAAIGQLAAGIAHELNTPLGSILVAAEVTRESAAAGSEGAQLLGDIVRETKRCKEITRSLLDFSRKRDLSLDFTDAGEVVRQAVGLVKREAGARAGCVE
ncbi:MAG: hypothetical protein HYY18_09080, partial [Planctomycetes bacterium]|nr:hypothetical protein [Planctomycetota bacterium]